MTTRFDADSFSRRNSAGYESAGQGQCRSERFRSVASLVEPIYVACTLTAYSVIAYSVERGRVVKMYHIA